MTDSIDRESITYDEFIKLDIPISEEIQTEIDRVVMNASWNPIPIEVIESVKIEEDDLGNISINTGDLKITRDDVQVGHTVTLPYGIVAIMTHEEFPGIDGKPVLCKRLLFTGDWESCYFPHPDQINTLLPKFGFINDIYTAYTWLIETVVLAVSVLEPLDGNMLKLSSLENIKQA